ncbi:MAG: REP-associated tyrosine transposase [Arenicellales bacterium]
MTDKPHSKNLRRGRYSQPGQIYHITTTTYHRKPVFTELYVGRCLVRAMMEACDKAETMAYVLMPDHFHWLFQLQEKTDLSSCVARVKSISAHRINKYSSSRSPVWDRGFHDHAVRKEEDIVHIARYIVTNPVRAGLVKSLSDYPFWDAVWV